MKYGTPYKVKTGYKIYTDDEYYPDSEATGLEIEMTFEYATTLVLTGAAIMSVLTF